MWMRLLCRLQAADQQPQAGEGERRRRDTLVPPLGAWSRSPPRVPGSRAECERRWSIWSRTVKFPPPAALGGVSYRTRRSFCRIRFDLTPRGLRLKNTHFESPEIILTSTVVCSVNPGFCLNRKEGGACCMMNGSSSSVSASQSSRVKSEQDDWRKEDCLTLLERIRSLLPDVDAMKYKTTESHFDWEKVCFGSFTGDMCRQKWQKVSTEVRKYRTMTELIVDAIEFVKNPYKGKKLKTHPDFPKKPLTPYFRFFMEKRAKYAKIHPEMSNLDLTKILSKKYKELPDKKKQKYIAEFQREKEEFEKNMARFKEEHPELMEERKKSDLPEKPKTPQQLWYNHEKKTYMKLHPEVSQKELKEALRRQWSQLSDKRRLKWISKALELQKDYEDSMRAYHEAHPDVNSDDHVRSVLTKAERQLKDKFDGRPTKPPPNGYSLYCAELMVNMKDVPSTERMVLCSKQWKMMTQKEKDMFQKRCEQKKKQYDVDLQRFLESLPEEERDRVLTEEKLGGGKLSVASSPRGAKSPSLKDRCREVEPESCVPTRPLKERRDGKKTAKLPETPKTAEEMWQHSVIGDYLAKYRSDRRKAQAAMEAAWKSMEKKEKIPWIKRAAEDQKRYEVQYQHVRELLEMRAPATGQTQRKPKFDGEPKKPPVSGYQMFSQELLTNGELNHFSLKERMVEIGKRWHKLSQSQKDKYKKQVEEQQVEYKAELEAWVKSLSPQDRAVYKEFSSSKRRSTTKARSSPGAKVHVTAKGKAVSSRATTPGVSVGKRPMAYRAKDMSDTDEEEEKSSSDSDEDDETSGTTDSDDDENDDEDDEDQTSSEESSDSDSD
ncbi:upstream binding transcription factor, like isoform X2 [Paralichthys olivaceus]|uniref:upstream binding transcription factor, like isoform X2 n=1 Tax=Paralichthys olivaceus TaxID=8255 RepID=UPI003750B3B1